SRCGERHGWFTSHIRSGAPCQTVGRSAGCFDATTGRPVPCPSALLPDGSYPMTGPVIPGGSRPIEMGPMPNENNMIPPPAVPVPAGPPNNALLPFPATSGTPVKGPSNK
ncbi:MAG TPA: hypothetical protein VGE74_01140, partial [Gemmata sp.]